MTNRINVLFKIRLSPFQGLKQQSVFIHSASHHAIAKALSEQKVVNTYKLENQICSICKICVKNI